MSGTEPSPPVGTCRCGALMQQSWWHEILEKEHYRVERIDGVNGAAGILTFSVASGPEARHSFYITVADVDWPALLANFAEPIVTRNGEDAAMLVHDMLLAKLRALLAADHEQITTTGVIG